MSILFFTLNLLVENISWAYVFSSIHYLSMSWVLSAYFQVVFALAKEDMTKEKVSKSFRVGYLITLTADAIHMLVNNIVHFSYTLKPVYYDDGSFYYWQAEYHTFFYLHLLLCYAIAISIIVELVVRAIKAEGFYRHRFSTMLGYFLLLLLTNSLYYIFKWDIDYSNVGFFLLTIAVFNYFYNQLPKQMIDNMMTEVTDNVSNGVACFSVNGQCIFMNDIASRVFCGKEVGCAFVENYHKGLMEKYKDKDFVVYEESLSSGGSERVYDITFQKIYDVRKRLVTSFIKLEDKTESLRRYEAEKYNASHDRMTGLLNRKAFFECCTELLRENPEKEYYILATNIKDLKIVNDVFGTDVGDYILKFQAEKISAVKDFCAVGRISGDRYGILVEKKKFNLDNGISDTNLLKDIIKDMNYTVTVCIGVYEIANHYESISLMFDKAVIAMESVLKDTSKTFGFYSAELMDKLLYQRNVLSEFHSALEQGQFEMYLQPQVNCNNQCLGAEALVRWNHPEQGILAPVAFIEILENSGYIYELDKYIWERAAEKLSDWKKRGIDKYISVNISARDFYFADLVQVFTQLVQKYDIEPEKMNLEITETVILNDMNFHKSVLYKLKSYGFSIEMDDFGTGYSSLNTLKDLQMDVLKIDMGFLWETVYTDRAKKIYEHVVLMAKKLGMTVITEGVENSEHLEFLISIGCELFQGYYFSKPVSVDVFESKFIEKKESNNV